MYKLMTLLFACSLLTVNSFTQDDEKGRYFIFSDSKAFEQSKQISQITVKNCAFRMILNREGSVYLYGKTDKLKEGTYAGDLRVEEENTSNPFFDSIAYLVEKMRVMELPEEIKGNAYDFCTDSFEFVRNGITKKVTLAPDAFVPELQALSALTVRVVDFDILQPHLPVTALEKLRLSGITRIASKGRIQDNDLNNIKTVEYIIAVGKPSIPWLIDQLEDDSKIDHHVVDYWYQIYVGDVALFVLSDLFQDRSGQSTIPGFGWDEFLERKTPDKMAEEVLRDYINKYGRSKIKSRWQEFWEKRKEEIRWDQNCLCFKLDEKK